MSQAKQRGPGRPPKRDGQGRTTDERLLLAAEQACVESGFEGATLADIAKRANVSTPAIYNHFSSKSELIYEAARAALARVEMQGPSPVVDPNRMLDTFLSPAFADQRTLLLELNLASLRHPDVAALMAEWYAEFAQRWSREADISLATAKTVAIAMFGMLGLDAMKGIDVDARVLRSQLEALFDNLVRDRGDENL